MPISYARIIYENNKQPRIIGTTFTYEGLVYAQWKTTAVAILYEKNELFYHWEGYEMNSPNETFSGVGAIRFNEGTTECHFGTGWYSLGNINDMKIEGRQIVDFMRIPNKSDIQSLKLNPNSCHGIVVQAIEFYENKKLPNQTLPDSVVSPIK